jgi:16S rRNA (cytidine1402-2'-O)-methyltransferase
MSSPDQNHLRIAERTADEVKLRLAEPLAPGLYLVATPIGNLADVTVRALAVLARADRLYCEDTRQSLKLLSRYGIERRLDTYHEHNAERVRPQILTALAAGGSVALISDAGTPLVSDPGFKLVRGAIEAGCAVHAVPGASAVLAGLVGAGLPTDAFHFAGFLPQRGAARVERISELAAQPATLVLFEAPSRLAASLADLATGLGSRQAAVARELTKLNETYHRGTLTELAAWAAETGETRGELVVVIAPGETPATADRTIVEALEIELVDNSVRDAATTVARRLGVARRRVYDLAIQVNKQRSNEQNEER